MCNMNATDTAIRLSNEKQEHLVPSWNFQAQCKLKKYLQLIDGCEFITEQFRKFAEVDGLEVPAEPRAYGAVIRRAVSEHIIVWTGNYKSTNDRISHERPMKSWVENKRVNFKSMSNEQI